MKRIAAISALAVLALVATGCSSAPETTTITVSAASSLTGAFQQIGAAFTAKNPSTSVVLNFGGSNSLAEQINSGAAVDLFASASTTTMDTVVKAGRAANPVIFATNTMTIAVPPDNPGHITSLADLTRSGLKIATCQAEVPCGAAATKLFEKNNISVTPATLEPDVKSVLAKVQSGDADAGIVYVTDVKAAASSVSAIDIPADSNVTTSYPIAVVTDNSHLDTATAFEAFVLSAEGRAILNAAGFGTP